MAIDRLPSPGAGIPTSTVTAKGDLIVGTANNAVSRLGVGANGTTLVADSAEATGMKWAAASGGGKVLQVVQGTSTTEKVIASTSQTDTNLTATITPSSTASKILIIATSPVNLYRGTTGGGQNEQNVRYLLLRGATTISGSDIINAIRMFESSNGYDQIDSTVFFTTTYLDSPSTTSSTTYKIQARAQTTNQGGQIAFQSGGGFGSITLLEIGA